MPVDARGQYDAVIDRMVTALEAYSTAQSVIDSSVAYRVLPGNIRSSQSDRLPTVGVALAGMRSGNETARAREWDAMATYHLDLVATARGTASARADERAYGRLMYLIQQVLNALYESDRRTAIEAGAVTLEWPTIQLVEPAEFAEEAPVIGARLTIEARISFVPAPTTGTPIESLHVDTGLWSGLYEYGGST